MIAIKNGTVVTGGESVRANIYFEGGKICAVTPKDLPAEKTVDAENLFVAPGFIDIHTHGAGGSDFLDGTANAFLTAARVHAEHGATSIVPTLTSVSTEKIEAAMAVFDEAKIQNQNGANLLGLHLEGPYFAASQKGAQEERFIKPFDKNEYEAILTGSDGRILRWSAAPELPGAKVFAARLKDFNILPCTGHSDADCNCALKAFGWGFRHVTHLYSCMSSVHRTNGYRHGGIVEAAFLNDFMTVELIADDAHLPPELLKLVYKIKGPEKIALITDSMRGAGMPEGKSVLGCITDGLPVIVEDGVAKLPDRTAFAGSVATCDRLVKTMVQLAEIPLSKAVQMASQTPADILSLTGKGQIKEGFDADIVIFNKDIHIMKTIVGGKVVYG